MKITEIIIDESIYPRNNCDPETVSRYREALEVGATLPPLVVMTDGRLLDGRHRYEAYKQAGVDEVEVIVEEAGDPDARAVELNLSHGRPLSREELKEAARRWYGKMPVTAISKTLGVTRQTVQNWVSDLAEERQSEKETIREKALEMRAEGKTQEEVAEKIGVDQATVSRWEYASVKNLTPAYTENTNIQSLDADESNKVFESHESREDGKENDEEDQENEFPESATTEELDLVKAIIGCRIETHYGTGGIVTEVNGPYEDGFYTITYNHPLNGQKCWINSITVKENTVLCEGVPLKITEEPGEKKPVPDIEASYQEPDAEKKIVSDKSELKWDKCKTCPCYQPDSCVECEHKNNPWCHDLYPDECTEEDCEEAKAARRENEEGQPDHTPHAKDDQEEKQETAFKIGRAAAEEERKKILPYSDMVKEFYNQLKKTSELAEQLVNRREDLIESIAGMEADGISITVLANAVIQACDIYFPRLSEARDILEEAIKRGVKGVVVKDRFMVVQGGKKDGG